MARERIDAAIKRHADFEMLYDKPYEDTKKVRVTGPFTVESAQPAPVTCLAGDGEESLGETEAARTPMLRTSRSRSSTTSRLPASRTADGRSASSSRRSRPTPVDYIQAIGSASRRES